MVEDKKIQYKRCNVNKISSMHYMEWTRITLPAGFEELDLVCIFSVFFSFHCYFDLVKGQLYQKSVGGFSPPVHPVSTGLAYLIEIFEDNYNIVRDRFEIDSVNVMKNRPLVPKKHKGNFNIY